MLPQLQNIQVLIRMLMYRFLFLNIDSLPDARRLLCRVGNARVLVHPKEVLVSDKHAGCGKVSEQLLNGLRSVLIRCPVLPSSGTLCQGEQQRSQIRRRLLQSSDGSEPDSNGPDVPECSTPWEVFNSTAELSFWAEALQTVGFSGRQPPYTCRRPFRLQSVQACCTCCR